MRVLWSAVLATALFLGFASDAHSRATAMTPTASGEHVIILTDESFEACPENSQLAAVYSVKEQAVVSTVAGCWVYGKFGDSVIIYWMNSETEETFTTELPWSDFVRLQTAAL